MSLADHKRLTVSVIIPAYNRAEFIKAAVDSALNQTHVPDEILVVDDGSTDATPDILAQYCAPVRVIRQENRGRSAARNVGLREAIGDAFMFLDSDDTLMPTSIERCVETLERRPEVGVVYTDVYITDRDGNKMILRSLTIGGNLPSGMVLGELARRCFLTVSSMVRRSFMQDIFFEEGMHYCEDYDVWRRLAARCEFAYVDEPLMCYRFHESMTITTKLVETLEAELDVQRRIMAMPEFAKVPGRQKARAYCSHGAKEGLLGRGSVGRRYFSRGVLADPFYLGGYALLGLSLLGTKALQYVIVKRRKMLGNQLGAAFGDQALAKQRNPGTSEKFALPTLQPEIASVEGGAGG